jgi:hypothetical protein
MGTLYDASKGETDQQAAKWDEQVENNTFPASLKP